MTYKELVEIMELASLHSMAYLHMFPLLYCGKMPTMNVLP